MLWQLLRGSGYGEYGSVSHSRDSETVGDLDPIACAGGIKVQEMQRAALKAGLTFVFFALALITSISAFESAMKVPPRTVRSILRKNSPKSEHRRRTRYTNDKYLYHLESLCLWGLLREVRQDSVRDYSTYFSVPKGQDPATKKNLDRSIFNAKKLSKLFHTPPTVNTADVCRVLREICKLQGGLDTGGVHIVTGGFRHYFHQYRMHPEISTWFGLACNIYGEARHFVWTCLPMGWSHSPYVAQSGSWLVLGHAEKGETEFFSMRGMANAPMFVYLRCPKTMKVVGFMTVYYDNYFVVTTEQVVAEDMSRRILRNAKTFNVEVKEHFTPTPNSLLSKPAKYLGIEISLSAKRDREGNRNKRTLQWRIAKEQEHEPFFLLDKNVSVSCKTLCQTLGRCMYARLVSLRPLGSVHTTRILLSLLRRISAHAWTTSWASTDFIVRDDELQAVKAEWEYVLERGLTSWIPLSKYDRIVRVATDASDNGWGIVFLDETGAVIPSVNSKDIVGFQTFPTDYQKSHIFLKEMFAAVEGVKEAVRRFPDCKQVSIVVDNTATAAALKRGYSTNSKATLKLSEIDMFLEVITVPSKANVADSPSRNAPIEEARRLATHAAFEADLVGQRMGNPERHPNDNKCGLRHTEGHLEGLDDDLELDCSDDFMTVKNAAMKSERSVKFTTRRWTKNQSKAGPTRRKPVHPM